MNKLNLRKALKMAVVYSQAFMLTLILISPTFICLPMLWSR